MGSLVDIKLAFSSISLVTSLLVVMLFFINKELRTPTFRLVLQLQIADSIYALASMINSESPEEQSLWYFIVIIIDHSQFQAYLLNYARQSSIIWSGLFAYNMYATIVANVSSPSLLKFYAFAIIIPILMSILPFISDAYGQNVGLCWIKPDQIGYALVNYVILLYCILLLNIIHYILTFRFLKHVTGEKSYKLFIYPVVLFSCQLWTSIVVSNKDTTLQSFTALDYFSIIFSSLQGFINSLVYGLTPQVIDILKSVLTHNRDQVIAIDLLSPPKNRSVSMQVSQINTAFTNRKHRESAHITGSLPIVQECSVNRQNSRTHKDNNTPKEYTDTYKTQSGRNSFTY